jgi:hypothetical protein
MCQELIRSGAEYKPKRLGWSAFVNMMKIKTNLLLITQVAQDSHRGAHRDKLSFERQGSK